MLALESPLHPELEVGDLLVSYLAELGIEYVFGIPGGAIEPLYNALARSQRRGGPRPVGARHETGAAFMADGYARATGKMGVCCATTGPGATNLLTGVASAHENSIPMLVVTGQTALADFGRGALQDSSGTGVDTVGMFRHCTRYSTLVSHVGQFERKLTTAILRAHRPHPGPAHVSIPLDVLRAPAPSERLNADLAAQLRQPALVDEHATHQLCRHVAKARRVVFVIGAGAGEAIGTILDVALALGAPIVTTPSGKGLVSSYHPLFRGVVGFAGHRSAIETLVDPDVDTVVAIGTTFGEWASGGFNQETLLNDRLIHVDALDSNLERSTMAKLQVRGRVSLAFRQVLNFLSRREGFSTEEKASPPFLRLADGGAAIRAQEPKRCFVQDDESASSDPSAPIKPQRLMNQLGRMFPPDTRYLADTGSSLAWAVHYLHPRDRRTRGGRSRPTNLFSGAIEFASMGWAIGAAIGVAMGRPGGPVVCITGDGSLLMSGQELSTAVQYGLGVVFVILNDSALGMVKHGQRLARAEPVGYELPDIDFAAYARALGAQGYVIRSPDDLSRLDVNAICSSKVPTLLDVRIDREEVPPIGLRMKALDGRA